jgi:diketogulonate reductase-like aldo/keto reductase
MAISATAVRTTELPSGESVPVLGMGTWHLAEGRHPRHEEIDALRAGLALGINLIDTAEMYADGGAEVLVGEAIRGHRDEVFLVSKVLPHNATRSGTPRACEASLRRLGSDRLDLYLLHWRPRVPLQETVDAFEGLIQQGKIRYWGVSNLDIEDMEELVELDGGQNVTTDQVLYNLTRRGIEWDLLPWCRQRRIPIMAYSPIEQGRFLNHPALQNIAARHAVSPAQIALAWVIRTTKVIAIPEAGTPIHLRDNAGALKVQFTERDLEELDREFPPPNGPVPLEML